MHHAINAGKRRAPTLVTMRIELLLGEDIAASLVDERKKRKKKNQLVLCQQIRDPVIPTHLA